MGDGQVLVANHVDQHTETWSLGINRVDVFRKMIGPDAVFALIVVSGVLRIQEYEGHVFLGWALAELRRKLKEDELAEMVAVRVNAEESVERNGYRGLDLAERYGIATYPTMLLLDSGGRELSRAVGYKAPRQFLNWLRAR